MSDHERRKKMISLRLSDTEYALLKAQYRTHGARNVSDLARLALQQFMHAAPRAPEDHVASKLADLEGRIHALESDVWLVLDPKVKAEEPQDELEMVVAGPSMPIRAIRQRRWSGNGNEYPPLLK